MFLSARQQNFILKFPKGFFYKEIEDRYLPLINRLPVVYEKIKDAIVNSNFDTFFENASEYALNYFSNIIAQYTGNVKIS
jgi:hypothetical protein